MPVTAVHCRAVSQGTCPHDGDDDFRGAHAHRSGRVGHRLHGPEQSLWTQGDSRSVVPAAALLVWVILLFRLTTLTLA